MQSRSARRCPSPASDTINAADGEPDVVDCGDGIDKVYADSFDTLERCEVQLSTPPPR